MALFDDCLSAVDAETEEKLFNNIGNFLSQKTTIFITHRLHHLHQYDRIVVMDKGKIAETGTYNELIKSKGLFYQLYMQQQNDLNKRSYGL